MKISNLLSRPSDKLKNCHNNSLLFISLLMICGAIIYYFYALNWIGVVLTIIFSVGIFIALQALYNKHGADSSEDLTLAERIDTTNKKPYLQKYYLLSLYVASYLGAGAMLISSRSDRALITPWAIIPTDFFWLYALTSLFLVFILIKKDLSNTTKLVLLSAHYFISLGVPIIVYKISYGYDPFIHEATMRLIDTKGFVLPKPPYYLGEYSLIIVLHKISGLTIAGLNKILVPILVAIFLPTALYKFLKSWLAENIESAKKISHNNIFLIILFLLSLTFSPFILSTPQNLSYLFLILTILSGLSSSRPAATWILALATTALHPLAGLPALTFAAVVSLTSAKNILSQQWQKIIKSGIFLFSSLALPLTLFFAAGRDNKLAGSQNIFSSFKPWLINTSSAGREDFLSNFVYFFANNYPLFIILLGLATVLYYYFYNRQQTNNLTKYQENASNIIKIIIPSLLIAYLLSKQINFNDLINYEQSDYASRLPIIIIIFLLPFWLMAGYNLIKKIRQSERAIQIICLIFGLGLLNVALYSSYPRFDKYWNSHGYSTSQNDIEAVKSVARDTDMPYIVLANQQVSAAALKELGFDHYHDSSAGAIYFYPIPTGGPLYQYYLDMVYKAPDQKTMTEAMAFAGVERGYLIVNKYWYQSDRIIAAARLTAQEWWDINNEVYIFKY